MIAGQSQRPQGAEGGSVKIKSVPARAVTASALAAVGLLTTTVASAAEYQVGNVDISFSTVLSAGILIRAEDPSLEFIAPGNRPGGYASTNAYDDPSLNFDKGDVVSSGVKALSELKLSYENFGAVISGKAWYDYELSEGDRPHGNMVNGYRAGAPLSDDGLSDLAQFKGVELLEAYVRGSFDLGDHALEARVGRQVVSWGESTFIGGGINSINPIDVSAFRRPGAELKEGLLPVGLAYVNFGITGDLSLEAFYEFEWAPTEIDACGTYFSTVDAVAHGCNGFTLGAALADTAAIAGGRVAKRAEDLDANDGGQYGAALRYYSAGLDTEFGAYFVNYHSRTPYISVFNTTAANGGVPFIPGDPLGGNFRYVIEYPEDIQLYGLSFASVLAGVSVAGEVSYRPDMPVQLNANDLLAAFASGGAAVDTPISPDVRIGSGALYHGYDEADQYRATVSGFKVLPPMLGAVGITVLGEVGAEMLDGLPADKRYGRTAVYGVGARNGVCRETTAKKCDDDGYVTTFSWGYRGRAIFDYPDVVAGINAKPFLSWSHDVNGTASDGTYIEGRMALGLGLDLDYQGYSVGGSYVRFIGGEYNYGKDRDFFSLNATARF
ncbi:DUF1302 domain-containing protein [Oleomonas cavernae]|uniref:DUF1302 domain-containing protein n=1 Tax=Oleomonas cavernae TaxID=2320859 RepID=A0A418WHG1_9PROT|nr:DUF1302 domain-containing protein [Oleomonas cavernae]